MGPLRTTDTPWKSRVVNRVTLNPFFSLGHFFVPKIVKPWFCLVPCSSTRRLPQKRSRHSSNAGSSTKNRKQLKGSGKGAAVGARGGGGSGRSNNSKGSKNSSGKDDRPLFKKLSGRGSSSITAGADTPDNNASSSRGRARAGSSASDASSATESVGGGNDNASGGYRWGGSSNNRGGHPSSLGLANLTGTMRPEHLSGLSVDGIPPVKGGPCYSEFDRFGYPRTGSRAGSWGTSPHHRTMYSSGRGTGIGSRSEPSYGGGGGDMKEDPLRRRREVGWNRGEYQSRDSLVGEMRGYNRPDVGKDEHEREHSRNYGTVRDWRMNAGGGFGRGGRDDGGGERCSRSALRTMPPGAVVLEVCDELRRNLFSP